MAKDEATTWFPAAGSTANTSNTGSGAGLDRVRHHQSGGGSQHQGTLHRGEEGIRPRLLGRGILPGKFGQRMEPAGHRADGTGSWTTAASSADAATSVLPGVVQGPLENDMTGRNRCRVAASDAPAKKCMRCTTYSAVALTQNFAALHGVPYLSTQPSRRCSAGWKTGKRNPGVGTKVEFFTPREPMRDPRHRSTISTPADDGSN